MLASLVFHANENRRYIRRLRNLHPRCLATGLALMALASPAMAQGISEPAARQLENRTTCKQVIANARHCSYDRKIKITVQMGNTV